MESTDGPEEPLVSGALLAEWAEWGKRPLSELMEGTRPVRLGSAHLRTAP